MKILSITLFAAFALVAVRPAAAAESGGGLFGKLTSQLNAKFQNNAAKDKALKAICQKGSAFRGQFGVCRSGEGLVCGFKKEAFAICSIICGSIGKDYQGFNASKCVTKNQAKWGFNARNTPQKWVAQTIAAKSGAGAQLSKVCGLVKSAGNIAQLKPVADACNKAGTAVQATQR